MTTGEAMDLVRSAIFMLLIVSLPVLLTALIVSLVVSVMQALTQVTDPTLSFVPKILAVLLALAIVGPWMIAMLTDFGRRMFAWP